MKLHRTSFFSGKNVRALSLATVTLSAALLAFGTALGAPSTFEVTEDDNGYNGKVMPGGDGYAFTAEDSARYYKFLYIYDDLLLNGDVCAGSTNWHTVYIGNNEWHPVTVTVTNGARMVTVRNKNILFKGKGGTIVVSEPTDAPFTWVRGDKITTVIGDTYTNWIGTVGYNSKFTLTDSVTSHNGTNDILRLLANGNASYQFISNQNANVAARILFEGGELRSIYDDTTKFQVSDGAKIILQSVDGNPIRLCNFPYDSSSLFTGAGMLETAGNGDFILLQQPEQGWKMKTLTIGVDEGGSIVWGNTGNFKLAGMMYLKLTSDDVLPHGTGKGKVLISVGEYPGTHTAAHKPVVIDLNGTSNTVNGIVINNNEAYYSKWHVVTNSSETIATLGLDVHADDDLQNIMTTNLAANARANIRLLKTGAAQLTIGNDKATNILESVASTEIAEGTLHFWGSYALTRPLSVTGSGSLEVRSQGERTLDLSAIPDADLSIGGLKVAAKPAYVPTITKFRPAANGTLYLTNVSGELPRNYTVPINLTTVVDAENFASWEVKVNGEVVSGYVPVYENGVLKAKRKFGMTISIR